MTKFLRIHLEVCKNQTVRYFANIPNKSWSRSTTSIEEKCALDSLRLTMV